MNILQVIENNGGLDEIPIRRLQAGNLAHRTDGEKVILLAWTIVLLFKLDALFHQALLDHVGVIADWNTVQC